MKKLFVHFSLIVCVLSALIVDGGLQAQSGPCTLFVSTSGSDADNGRSETEAFRTIQRAANTAVPGEVVCIKGGTYGAMQIFPAQGTSKSGTVVAPITYRAFGDGKVTIDRHGGGTALWLEAEYLTFWDLTITCNSVLPGSVGIFLTGIESPAGSKTMNANHIVFDGVEVTGCATGILGHSDDTQFLNMDIHHNGQVWFEASGMYLTGARNRIADSRVHDNASTGIQLWTSYSDPRTAIVANIIENNLIYANGYWVETNDPAYPERNQYGRGIVFGSHSTGDDRDNVIRNNLIFANFPLGISDGGSPLMANTQIVNNTIIGNIVGISLGDATAGVIRNNIVFNNNPQALGQWLIANRPELLSVNGGSVDINRHGSGGNLAVLGSHIQDHNIIDADPQVVNWIHEDFHLTPTSPAIDAGTPQNAPSTDFEGTSRPQGAAYDIGAYEYAQDTDTVPPTIPTGLAATAVSSSQINLSWTASTDNVGVTGYKIYQNNIQIGTTAGTSYESTGLRASTSYSYRIAAYDDAGNTSAKSVSVTRKTLPSPSTKFTIGDRVQTTWKVTVRSTPSNSGAASGTQLKGAMGRVVGGPSYANLQWWWQIDFDSGVDGWVAQGKLKKIVP